MTGSGIEITIRFLQYVFTTLVLAMFHYDSSGNFPVDVRFQWQNEFLPTQNRLAHCTREFLQHGVLHALSCMFCHNVTNYGPHELFFSRTEGTAVLIDRELAGPLEGFHDEQF